MRRLPILGSRLKGLMSGDGGPRLILHDAFIDANGTSLDAHTIAPINIPATAWTERNGDWQISNNRADPNGAIGGNPYYNATCDALKADYQINVTLNMGTVATEFMGVIVRYNPGDGSFYWLAILNASVRIYEWTGSANTVRANVAGTFTTATDYAATITVRGSTISIICNGVTASYTSATRNQTSTICGLYAQNTVHQFDEFKIYHPFSYAPSSSELGDVFIIAGQSNAVGYGDNNQVYSGSQPGWNFANDYTFKALSDPLDSNTGQLDAVSDDNAANAKGTYWLKMATDIVAATGRPITLVPCPKSGSTITDWQPGADHQDRTTLYGSMIYRARQVIAAGGTIRAVLWHQGEAEASGGMSEADYNTNLDTIANAIAADLPGVVLIPCKLQNCTDRDETNVNAAIATAWADNANVKAGPDLSGITPSANAAHFTTDAEMTTVGTLWAAAVVTAFGW